MVYDANSLLEHIHFAHNNDLKAKIPHTNLDFNFLNFVDIKNKLDKDDDYYQNVFFMNNYISLLKYSDLSAIQDDNIKSILMQLDSEKRKIFLTNFKVNIINLESSYDIEKIVNYLLNNNIPEFGNIMNITEKFKEDLKINHRLFY